ncbi:UDP-2,3-diacylglucosamine diphosphatase [Edwardsiella ictaluri]|uniref:UDP-2,3-diacylglucosamine hydrolase n=1 Tax=Edwardsiella ictaluri TaxID=67780 RepID=A0ABY8GHK5_EDWIC|nr:UDP-2,3-diacylglucosamine diphosphatase [Edwardsiella ictaluri]ELV7528929.1 UDP-2,3-diacylglucosamine diphosphatase [Edwardsiella ictaluri]KMQ77838.1 UDP-2,3-diacylglucosamine hydrolase [Edwardsiella ictaluri]KOO54687.1 UDP-2,3-diacylglucosamine hydrolase [Edwardsiella ictaluri]QPW30892.1 UDP-2,3-diacylglucosamine diphosphatase [Edwardsiella ictaluri]UYB61025.1 UDP-2,3-diacylglucosamine diphosphatase [Edwardsiella ictaluri]
MATLFIADLHLSQQEPAITAGFLRFLAEEAPKAEALYILGDFFDYWIGDDDPQPLHRQVAGALRQLSDNGVPCYFICGNRDFLLGKSYAKRCGMTLLPDEQIITLYGQPILLLHGDTLCSDDRDYLRYRRRVHNPLLQWLFRRLPLRLRLKIAVGMRQQSQRSNSAKAMTIMDVNQETVCATLRRHGVQRMIHGHTHRPALHHFSLDDGRCALRAVLGAWHTHGSMIRVDAQGIHLIELPAHPAEDEIITTRLRSANLV